MARFRYLFTRAYGFPGSRPERQVEALRDHLEDPLPLEPREEVYFTDGRYALTVEICRAAAGEPVVTGIAVRRLTPHVVTGGEGTRTRLTPEGEVTEPVPRREPKGSPRPLSGRDVRRMPLASLLRAATVAARGYTWIVEPAKVARALVPRRDEALTPEYYRKLLEAHRAIVARGSPAPVKELAERHGFGDNVNLIHQRLHRARELERLGRLPPPRGRRKGAT